MIQVSIIIVNYNTCRMTADCIDSIIEHTRGVEYEIILVDNASTDGSRDFFTGDRRIKYVYSEENLGFGRGNNLGIALSQGQYLFLLNNDTLLTNNAVKTFLDYEEAHGGSIVLGCTMVDGQGKATSSFGAFPTASEALISVIKSYFRKEFRFPVTDKAELNVDMIVGADMFIPKEAIDKSGSFDNDFFMYYEEADLQKRFAENGFIRRIISGPGIIHFGGCSDMTPQRASRMRYNMTKSLFIYLKKHSGRIEYMVFRFAYAFIRVFPAAVKNDARETKKQYIKLLFSRI